jgi:hypothetical protein
MTPDCIVGFHRNSDWTKRNRLFLVPRARFQILDDGSGLRVPLRDLECTEVLLACIALINGPEDVDVLVFRVGHTTPGQFHRCGLYVLYIQTDIESVKVCNKMNRIASETQVLLEKPAVAQLLMTFPKF